MMASDDDDDDDQFNATGSMGSYLKFGYVTQTKYLAALIMKL